MSKILIDALELVDWIDGLKLGIKTYTPFDPDYRIEGIKLVENKIYELMQRSINESDFKNTGADLDIADGLNRSDDLSTDAEAAEDGDGTEYDLPF